MVMNALLSSFSIIDDEACSGCGGRFDGGGCGGVWFGERGCGGGGVAAARKVVVGMAAARKVVVVGMEVASKKKKMMPNKKKMRGYVLIKQSFSFETYRC